MNVVGWVFSTLLAVLFVGVLVFVTGVRRDVARHQRIRRT